ncbi:Serine/threonine-protein phosphatase 7 long form-like protein [Rhynchospora pubera]|uniref:Serine/threonine-protein phosphatase 7 long form-like protein n=1 Tax=Rhynchospora pubera TaxID=906938 RepID=A0AAV8BQF1_9POAL|nr:Serine/threonine-protein phosphatase 7 long form-like protein [Rhynchospora pubera]
MEDVLDCLRERATDRRAGRKLHAVQFGKLRDMWAQGPGSEDADRIDRYTRALLLELMGCEMFPDTTGDSVPCFYLELLRDVHASDSVRYNWGAATLAMLYRGLDLAVLANGAQKVPAPWLLLQLWSYTRLLLCRPSVMKSFQSWGKPSVERCPPYGRQWTTRLRSKKVKGPVRSGIEYARDVLMKMEHAHVVWRPYEDELRQVVMPPYARYEQRYYRLRVPCIHFWVVAWHYADRVMHQFMLFQTVPPPLPTVWRRMEALLQYRHNTFRQRDLQDIFSVEVAMWADTTQVEVAEARPWSDDILPAYDRWMRIHGGAHLVPIPGVAQQIPASRMTYLEDAPERVSMVKHILTQALRACAWAVKKGFRRAGKEMLKGCRTQLELVGEPHRLPHLLESKGLATDIDSIPDSPEEDHAPEPAFEEHQFMTPSGYTLHDWDTYFDQPRPSQPIVRSRRTESQPSTQSPIHPFTQPPISTGELPTPPGPPPGPYPDPPTHYEYQTQYPPY